MCDWSLKYVPAYFRWRCVANMQLRVHETSGIYACSYKKVLFIVFFKILVTDESYVCLDPISHDCMARNSALVFLWLLAHPFCFAGGFSQAVNLTLNWEAEQLVSKIRLASAPPSSRSQCAAIGCTPQPSCTLGAGAPEGQCHWHGSATTKVTSS